MHESIHGYVIEQLQKCKGQWPRVSAETGIPKRSIEKIARQEWLNPGVNTIQPLLDYFEREDGVRAPKRRSKSPVREA